MLNTPEAELVVNNAGKVSLVTIGNCFSTGDFLALSDLIEV